jgi:hypothetical protein
MEGGDPVAVAIFGSTTKSNVLIGSHFADNLNGGSATDSIVTNGGGDGVNLGAGHTADLIGAYVAAGNAFATPGNAPNGGVAGAITDINNFAQAGFWGVMPGGTPIVPTTAFPNTGTSASMAVVNGFSVSGNDTVDFSISEWAISGTHFGLVNLLANGPFFYQPGAAVFSDPVVAGGTVTIGGGTTGSPEVLIFTTSVANAAQLASTLHTVGLGIYTPNPQPPGDEAHFLAAYQDLGGNVRIADVDIFNTSAAPLNNTSQGTVAASDMVQLAGVSLGSLIAHEGAGNVSPNMHFIA